MEIRNNNVDGLKNLLGVQQQTSSAAKTTAGTVNSTAFSGDQATVSSAGSEVAQAYAASDVRTEKVASVKSALDAGTYSVPASAVASKVVDALLGESVSSN